MIKRMNKIVIAWFCSTMFLAIFVTVRAGYIPACIIAVIADVLGILLLKFVDVEKRLNAAYGKRLTIEDGDSYKLAGLNIYAAVQKLGYLEDQMQGESNRCNKTFRGTHNTAKETGGLQDDK